MPLMDMRYKDIVNVSPLSSPSALRRTMHIGMHTLHLCSIDVLCSFVEAEAKANDTHAPSLLQAIEALEVISTPKAMHGPLGLKLHSFTVFMLHKACGTQAHPALWSACVTLRLWVACDVHCDVHCGTEIPLRKDHSLSVMRIHKAASLRCMLTAMHEGFFCPCQLTGLFSGPREDPYK